MLPRDSCLQYNKKNDNNEEECVVHSFAMSDWFITSKIPTELGVDRFTAASTVVR